MCFVAHLMRTEFKKKEKRKTAFSYKVEACHGCPLQWFIFDSQPSL